LPNIDWTSVSKADAAAARKRLRSLNEGALRSGEDFNRAANIFQHGSRPDDFLVGSYACHTFANPKGYSDATWIAAATLDRLSPIRQTPQVYVLSFDAQGKAATQRAYNRTPIFDSLRRQLGFLILAAQQVRGSSTIHSN